LSSNGAAKSVQHGYANWAAIGLEVVASAFLMLTYMGTAVDKQAPSGIYGFAVGGAYLCGSLTIGNITGGSLNPAKYYGTQIGALPWSQNWLGNEMWLYMSPFLGCVIGAFGYYCVFDTGEKRERGYNEAGRISLEF
jgi:glycerol uptake facilitator protein